MSDDGDGKTALAANPRTRSRIVSGRGLDEYGVIKGRCREAAVEDSRGGVRDGENRERECEGTHGVDYCDREWLCWL
jgi:hypothetical protein